MAHLTRETAVSALKDVIKIADELAAKSIGLLNNGHYKQSTAARIEVGLDLRKNLLTILSLANSNLDDQILIIHRTIFENVITMEYLSRKTRRGKLSLTTNQKGVLFISFPMYHFGLTDPALQKSREFKRAARIRKRLVKDDLYWHGANLKALCEELDSVGTGGKRQYSIAYETLYKTLSFVTHPNAKENVHYTEDSTTREIRLRPSFLLAENIFFATLWASRVIRRWAVATHTNRASEIDNLAKSWKLLLK